MGLATRLRDARGAVLTHAAVLLVALVAFTAMAVDWGVMFVGRTQAQSAADAGALAGGTSRSFVNATNFDLARNAAVAAARQNSIWGETPDVLTTDVTFPTCPPGASGVPGTCVKVDVFRTNYQRANGSPLPTFFAQLVGVNEQGARATATAQMRASFGTADCVKPWALADNWTELQAPFEEFNPDGSGAVDTYDPDDGWQLPGDYGRRIRLNEHDPLTEIPRGLFQPVRLDADSTRDYAFNVSQCNPMPIGPGTVLQPESDRLSGPTTHGFEDLIALDPTASWDTVTNRPVGGCMAAGTCGRSPRWVAVPVFNTSQYRQDWIAAGSGPAVAVTVVRVVGLWLDDALNPDEIYGYITHYPTVSLTGPGNETSGGAFARTVILVR
ncbi:MAG: pilus assembly protein TadG-related protein [Vicinamibacterales bacterium]